MASEDAIIETILRGALYEDLGDSGDVTTKAVLPPDDTAKALVRTKEQGVLSGIYLIKPLFQLLDPDLQIEILAREGQAVAEKTQICRLKGNTHAILAGERTLLNLLQRLSGIASMTAAMTAKLKGTNARLLDTRKTTPNLRLLEKRAVAAGGGVNHRFGLFDMILIKDTHVQAAGGVGEAVRRAREFAKRNQGLKIEAEVQTYEEFLEAAKEGPDRIMLDNMKPDLMSKCVHYIHDNNLEIETEASGNISLKTIRPVAETGVDFISAGCLTHSVTSLDIHLIIERGAD